MLVNTLVKKAFKADYYDYLLSYPNGGTTPQVDYVYADTIDIIVELHPGDARMVIYADIPLRKNVKVTNIVTQTGDDLFPGAEYRVSTIEPSINILGKPVGFRMGLALSNPITFDETA